MKRSAFLNFEQEGEKRARGSGLFHGEITGSPWSLLSVPSKESEALNSIRSEWQEEAFCKQVT